MKQWLWYAGVVLLIAALGGDSSAGKDVGKLQPVQSVYMTCQGKSVVIETDTGDLGKGDTLEAAVEDMKASAVGEVFLETADYLLLSAECVELLPEAMKLLRPSCSVCLADEQPDMQQVGAYLQIHAPRTTLIRYRAGERNLQTLLIKEEGMELVS